MNPAPAAYPFFTDRPACRAALCLNNLGVRLLERHCYQQALLTLRDALAILRFGVDNASQQQHGHDSSSSCASPAVNAAVAKFTQVRTRRAMSRLAAPEYQTKSMQLQTLSIESLSAVVSHATARGSQVKEGIIIYMEDLDMDQAAPADQDRTVLESSILMHNFAVTYQCLSRIKVDSDRRMDLLQGARTLQTVSSNLLRGHRDGCTDYFRLSRLLQLEVIVLSDCVSVLVELDQVQQAAEMREELHHLVEWVSEGQSFWKIMDPKPHAAGAA
jgi:hypothetical protein